LENDTAAVAEVPSARLETVKDLLGSRLSALNKPATA